MADISLKIYADAAQAEKEFNSFIGSSERVKKAVEEFQKSFDPKTIDDFIAKNKLAALGVQQSQGPMKGLAAETKGYEREIRKLISSGLNPQSAEILKLRGEYDTARGKLDQLTAATHKHNSAFAAGIKSVLGYAAAYFSLRGIVNVFKGIITEARKLEDAEAAFTPLIGGAEKAKELVKELNIAAAVTPFQFEDIQKTASTLLPVMNGDIQKTIDTFKMLGDTAGGSARKLESVTRGFTKAMLKGRVDMESLNMIVEAGVPVFQEMATIMGYGEGNMQAFFKEISTGKVSTDILIEAFKKMTSEGGKFYQGMIISSRTTSGVLSTLSDAVKMTGAGIGQAFLPYIKEAALKIIGISSNILKWVSAGDNLKNTLRIIGYSLAGLTAAFLAYNIATKASAAVIKIMEIAQRGLNTAMKANLIGIIATVITAVLVPAIILLVKNWDLVKYKITDFALAAKQKLLELGLAIREKVIGAVIALYDKLGDLPIIGEGFKKMADYQRGLTDEMKNNVRAVEAQRAANKAAYDQAGVERQKSIDGNNAEAAAIEEANIKKSGSYANYAKTMKEALDRIAMTEEQKRTMDLESATAFFEQRAELESADFDKRIAFLEMQGEVIKKIEKATNEQVMIMQIGLTKAIEKERQKQMKARLLNAQNLLSVTGTMISDLQATLANFGKASRELAVAGKAVAVAQAVINTYLGVTAALRNPWPLNIIASAITLAAGLAAVAKIVTTPIPSGQTGLEYTVPDVPANRNDKAVARASAGEKITITPRGEDNENTRIINIDVGEENLFSFIQRGIDTGKVNLSNKNIVGGVFA